MESQAILGIGVKRNCAFNFEAFRDIVLVVVLGGILIWTGANSLRAHAKAPPRINGAYTVAFGGDLTGKGKAVVTPKIVKIDGTFTDASGNSVTFTSFLDVDASTYRFQGKGSAGSVPATISGRVDADDKTLKRCRIVATYLTEDGKTGRIVGAKD